MIIIKNSEVFTDSSSQTADFTGIEIKNTAAIVS